MQRRQPGSNVLSMTGAKAGGKRNWAWCVPNRAYGAQMPICVLVMSSDGPRWMPTNVFNRAALCAVNTDYQELAPSPDDVALVEGVFKWMTFSFGEERHQIIEAVRVANDVAAANKFLPVEERAFTPAAAPIDFEAIYIGRSVVLLPAAGGPPAKGWIASFDEPFDVVILLDDSYVRTSLALEFLGEDGTAEVVLRNL
jgi:hypothetical protein